MNINKNLEMPGYGRKAVKVRCTNSLGCGWKGKRIWRPEMFNKPCPKCLSIDKNGKTTVFAPPKYVK